MGVGGGSSLSGGVTVGGVGFRSFHTYVVRASKLDRSMRLDHLAFLESSHTNSALKAAIIAVIPTNRNTK